MPNIQLVTSLLTESNPSRVRDSFTPENEILARIENWRRYFRQTQRIMAVHYYTPPELGDVMDELIVKLPCNMADAVRLELAWRQLSDPAKKWFIKWEYILHIPHPVIWRKLKGHNVRIKSYSDHFLYNRSVLNHFGEILDVKTTY